MVTELTFLCALESNFVTDVSSHTPKPSLTIICLSSLGQNPFTGENSTTFLSRLDTCLSVLAARKTFPNFSAKSSCLQTEMVISCPACGGHGRN